MNELQFYSKSIHFHSLGSYPESHEQIQKMPSGGPKNFLLVINVFTECHTDLP